MYHASLPTRTIAAGDPVFGGFPSAAEKNRVSANPFVPCGALPKREEDVLTATITIDELSRLSRSGLKPEIVDVRSETEFAAGHIPGAKCIPLQQLPHRHADLGAEDLILVCEAGVRAGMAQKSLSQRDGTVFVLDGGTRAWREAGLPMVELLGTRWSLERQVRLGAGVMVLIGVALTLLVSTAWILMPAFIGAGLTFAGATDICMLGRLLARMPWNQLRSGDNQRACNC
jgi:rhodanese-related sulfurtransferase